MSQIPDQLRKTSPATVQDLTPPAMAESEILLSLPNPDQKEHNSATSNAHAKFSEEINRHVREYIRNADQKASLFFAAATALLAYLNSNGTTNRWLIPIMDWSFTDSLAFFSMLGLAIGAIVLLSVVFPRLKGSRRGIIFFNAIAEYGTSGDYVRDVLCKSESEIVQTWLANTHELAHICQRKYRVLVIGLYISAVGTALTLLYMVMS